MKRRTVKLMVKDRRCSLCGEWISFPRLTALPNTQVCFACKQEHDEPPLTVTAPHIRGALAVASLDDVQEMQSAANEIARGE